VRTILDRARRAPTHEAYFSVAILAVVLQLWVNSLVHGLFSMRSPFVVAAEWWLLVVLLAVLGGVWAVWATLHSFGFVGAGSGTGIRLALLGLAARLPGAILLQDFGSDDPRVVYEVAPVATGPLWLTRNLGLVAYGCGLGLVVLATAVDLVRARRTPLWSRPVD
jgi:hypothetical protein